jgi:CRP/FNR family transcriptional regulator
MRVDWRHDDDRDVLTGLTPDEVRELRAASACRDYDPAETIFEPDPRPRSIYLLERGLVRIYRLAESGEELVLGYVVRGDVFGELAFLNERPRESFAEAVHRSFVWRIPREAFRRVVGRRADLVLRVSSQIADRFKQIESRVENLVFRDVRTRLASLLLQLAGDFGREETDGALCIDLPLTQAELGKLVGATRQTVNQSLRELEAEGLVGRREGRVAILAPDGLRSVAAPVAPAG